MPIHLEPKLISRGYPADLLDVVLIHEMTHCALAQHFNSAYVHFPDWYMEGLAEWVELVLGGGDNGPTTNWREYLNTPTKPLFARSYDGIGFFVHLIRDGHRRLAQNHSVGRGIRGH